MVGHVGKYELVSELGQGGFGTVYLARDPAMNRLVALKLMNGPTDPNRLSRFKNEAVITGNLNHPNLVTVYDLGDYDGNPYIAMEYLKGNDLSKILQNKPGPDLLERVRILAATLAGLRSAHDRGVIHRDIKPANIMLLDDGGVKIMDFGIARITSMALDRNTKTGMVIGSMQWMAPEQFRGTDADAQTDIWALGVTAYELFTSVHPFEGDTMHTGQMIYQIMSGKIIPARFINQKLPPALDALIHRMMQRDRGERFQVVEDIELDLQPILTELWRERAAVIAEKAAEALSSSNLELALKLAREGLDLDPHNQTLRSIRDQVLGARKRTRTRTRVEGLLKSAEEAIRESRFDDARAQIESVREAEPGDTSSEQRLHELDRLLQEQSRVEELLSRARNALAAGDLETTRQALGEAHSMRPSDSTIREIGLRYRDARDLQKKFGEVNSKLEQCQSKLAVRDCSGALELLLVMSREEVRAAGVEAKYSALLQTATEGERLQRIWARAKEFESAGRFQEAVAALDASEAGGDWPEIEDLRRRVLGIADVLAQGSSLIKSGNPERALQELAGALGRFGDVPALVDLRQQASVRVEQRQRDNWERSRLVDAVEAGIGASDWSLVATLLDPALRASPGDVQLLQLREKQRLQWIQQVRQAIEQGSWEDALRILQAGLGAFPQDRELLALGDRAHRGDTLGNAEAALQHKQWETARKLAEAVLRTNPGDAEFRRIAEQASSGEALAKAQNALQQQQWETATKHAEASLRANPDNAELQRIMAMANAAVALQKQDWEKARKVAEAGLKANPGDAELHKIAQQASRGLALANASAALQKQDWGTATQFADAGLRANPGDADFRKVADQASRGLALAHASAALQMQDWATAKQLADAGLRPNPGDADFQRILAIANANLAIQNQQWDKARQLAEANLRTNPSDADFRKIADQASRGLALAHASAALQKQDWATAKQLADAALRANPGDEDLRKIADQASRGQAIANANATLQNQQRDKAKQLADAALQANPQVPDLYKIADQASHALASAKAKSEVGSHPVAQQLQPSSQQQPSFNRKPLLIGGGAVAAVAVVVIASVMLLHEPEKPTQPTVPNTATGVATPDIPKDPPPVAVNKAVSNKAPLTATTSKIAPQTVKPEANNKQPVIKNAGKEPPAVQKEIPPVFADKPVEIPKKAASIPTRPADSDVPDYGTLSWEGTLEPGATLTCSGDRPSSGSIRGLQLLGVPVKLTVVSSGGIEILQAPSAANRWTAFTLRNTSSAPLYRIRLRWDTVR